MGRAYKVICAVNIVFLCIVFLAVGGIPTDGEDIILILSFFISYFNIHYSHMQRQDSSQFREDKRTCKTQPDL